jgi:iron-sulfur cluster assembly accessory protein
MVHKIKTDDPPPVILTKRTINQVKKAIVREQQPKNAGLRVLLVQMANGYRYDLQFETKEQNGDHISYQNGLKIFVDAFSLIHLDGTVLDFEETPGANGFLFERNASIGE